MGRLRAIWQTIRAYAIAVFALIGFVLWYGWRQRTAGEAFGKADAEHDAAKEKRDAELAEVVRQLEEKDADGLKRDLLDWRGKR